LAELQKDPITRSDFLGLGVIGAVMGTILTIPPVAFVLTPLIKTEVEGESDVLRTWERVDHVANIPEGEPVSYVIEFPIRQTYGDDRIQEESGVSQQEFTVRNGVWVSWRDGQPPEVLGGIGEGDEVSRDQIEELTQHLNVMNSTCAHLGCPVRWVAEVEELLCPCHGGLYDINGEHIGGPPPRDLYRYTFEIREDGFIYITHEFDGDPYIV
jgi:Rieske Fe-S protein